MAIILVSLKTDNGKGSALVTCTGIKKDPILPDNRILENVKGLLWPFEGAFVRVSSWSVNRKSINHWMVGDVYDPAALTLEMLDRAKRGPPIPPGTSPEVSMSNDPEHPVKDFIEEEKATAPPLT